MNQLMLHPGKVHVLDDVLPQGLTRELVALSMRLPWRWGWNTPSNPGHRYWHHEVGQGRKSNTSDVSATVRRHPERALSLYLDWLLTRLLPADARVLRFYLNAHTYGTDGWPHTDADRPGEVTVVTYLNAEWKPEWGGETVVFNEQGDISAAVLPRVNRLLAFPSDRLHAPRPLSKAFEGLRVVLVAKFGPGSTPLSLPPPGQGDTRLLGFLRDAGAQRTGHSGRSLLDHLWGTYRLLQLRGAEPAVCLAGLFHSVYGTSIFQRSTTEDRAAVRALIGERAEHLAWTFCRLQRPHCWSLAGDELPLAAGGSTTLGAQDRANLLQIERANLDEQGLLTIERRRGVDLVPQ